MLITTIIFALLVAAALAVSPRFGERLYRRMIFAPVKCDAGEVDIAFASGKNTLHAVFHRQPNSRYTVLFSHSNWGNIGEWERLAEQLHSCGVQVFAYDYRGYGASTGVPSVKGLCQDGIAAYDYLVRVEKIPASQIVLFGSSLGTGVTCAIARTRPCAGIILHAAFSSLRNLVLDMMPATRYLPESLFFRPKFDNVDILKELRTPLLLVHGEYDEMADISHAQAIHTASASSHKTLVILPGAAHMQTAVDDNLFETSVTTFLQSLNS